MNLDPSRAHIPLPPTELRSLIGTTDPEFFDNPSGRAVFPAIGPDAYAFVFDFGCGCGRNARKLLQADEPPRRYVGVDLHRGMIQWCRDHLQPLHPGFEFHHQDVFCLALNPEGTESTLPWMPHSPGD